MEEVDFFCVDLSVPMRRNELADMKIEINMLTFGLQRFAGSDDDIRFCTAFPSYSTLTSFCEFLHLLPVNESTGAQLILRIVPQLMYSVVPVVSCNQLIKCFLNCII